MKPIGGRFLFFIICVLVVETGCGYRLDGEGLGPPLEIRSIAIPTFINATYEAGIEITVTSALLKELIKDRRLKVVGVDKADAVMEGTVTSFATFSASYDPAGFVREYRTWVTLDVILRRGKKGEILWSRRGLRETDVYRVSSGVLFTEVEKERAIQRIAEQLARRIRRALFEGT